MDLQAFLTAWHSPGPTMLLHTSGSTGTPKPITAEKRRMGASARITCSFLGLRRGATALLCLPLDYIAGQMMVVRALTWGLRLVSVEPTGHPLSAVADDQPIDFAAMVPLQVWQSLRVPAECERLRRIGHLIIGGGAVDDNMARQLADFPNAVWSTYGMTETLSHIALRRLSGPTASSWYTPFEDVALAQTADGCLVVSAPQVCADVLTTNDIVELRADGRFRVLGRRDNVICSGGIKIQAEEVERKLRRHTRAEFCITKRKDPRLGEAVVLVARPELLEPLRQLCRTELPRMWMPRSFIAVETIPTTRSGKVKRKEVELTVARLSAE